MDQLQLADRVSQFSEFLTLRSIATLYLAVAAILIVAPSRIRLRLALGITILTTGVSKLPDLGSASQFAKALLPGAYCYLIAAARTHPGPKRDVSLWAWLFPVLALASFPFVLHAIDYRLAIVFRVQWFLLTLAAVCLVKTVVDRQALDELIEGVLLGLGLTNLLTLSDLIRNPSYAIDLAYGRYSPFSANPNQIGLSFAIAVPLALHMFFGSPRTHARSWYLLVLVISVVQSLLTVSRATFVIAFIPSLPYLTRLLHQPLAMLGGGAALVLAIIGAMHTTGEVSFERLTSDAVESRRETFREAIEVMEGRYLFGLLGESNIYALNYDEVNAHNAYVDLFYLGGFALGLPHFLLLAAGHVNALRAWWVRRQLPFDPRVITMATLFSLCALLHGFVNGTLLYPTYGWALWNLVIAVFLLSLPFPGLAARHDPAVPRAIRGIPVRSPRHSATTGGNSPRDDRAVSVVS